MSEDKNKFFLALGYILALTGILFRIYSIISSITNFPFPIGWSEGGRIFAAFQVYAPIITGKYISLPWLDLGRSIFDGLVLLLPNSPIWLYRIWVSILFLVFSCLAALVTVRRVIIFSQNPDKQQKGLVGLLALWGLLFLLQGPIYYHVLAGIIPVLWFYNEQHPVRNLIIIILCSLWEGLCRANWFMMPATVAILFQVLRTPFQGNKYWNYIKWPLVYVFSGGISSFTIYWVYIKVMGYVIPFLNPAMDYPFFLYKLLPNAGYLGLLPGIVLVSFPALIITLYVALIYRKNIHWLRFLIIISILGIFFAGSTVVSLRAGGGYDLHNYDTFLLLLFITACSLGMDAAYLDKAGELKITPLTSFGVLVLILLIPILVAYPKTGTSPLQTTTQSTQALLEINHVLQGSTESSAEHPVLFIDQRQLLVFNIIREENIYIPYEKIELMEMAMARNQDYKRQFLGDLENHKFSLIVSEILVPWAKAFEPNLFDQDWYENNAWVEFVAIPVLNYYTPVYINKDFGIAIYAPK